MALTPLELNHRPFSVEPVTGLMILDGIFDTSIEYQEITCYIKNTSVDALNNVEIYLEGVADQGIVPDSETFRFDTVPVGSAIQVAWRANFFKAKPGKPLCSIRVVAEGYDVRRLLRPIFVSSSHYDFGSKSYSCTVPEGTITVRFLELLGPKTKEGEPPTGPWLITHLETSLVTGFDGQYGPLAFQDPLWKVVAAALALLAFIGSALVGSSENDSTMKCETDPATGEEICETETRSRRSALRDRGRTSQSCIFGREGPMVTRPGSHSGECKRKDLDGTRKGEDRLSEVS